VIPIPFSYLKAKDADFPKDISTRNNLAEISTRPDSGVSSMLNSEDDDY